MSTFWKEYPIIEKELEVVNDIMLRNVKCAERTIETALQNLINSGGKMLRPAFLIIASKFGEPKPEIINNLGAVIEMVHMATLIHDDIIDDAPLRRGSSTIQSTYGKNYAVFMGDFLLSRCFMLLSDKTSTENLKSISKVMSRICIGEIEQFSYKFVRNTSITKYLNRIAAKTAVLFSLSLYVGARESGADEKLCKNIGRAGFNIGMAFQIIDDILDYSSEEKVVGKPVGNDLKEGIFTLPLIYALRSGNGDLTRILSKEFYDDKDIRTIINIVREAGGIEKARVLAKKYTDKAFKQLSALPDCDSKRIIMEVSEKLLIREY
jgi:heptaprenyl diphosphate synthase